MIESRISQIRKFLLFSLPYLLIYSMVLSNLVVILYAVATVAELVVSKKINFSIKGILFAGMPFIISALGLLYTNQLKIGLSLLETRIPLILLPILFCLQTPDVKLRVDFLRHFLVCLSITFFVALIIAVYRNYKGPVPEIWFNQWYYHYSDLTEPLHIEPLYLALFVSFGIIIVLSELLGLTNDGLVKKKSWSMALLIIFGVFIAILGVRSILIILVALIIYILFKSRNLIKNPLPIGLAIITVVVGISFISPVTRERFKALYNSKFEFTDLTIDRIIIWSVAYDYVKDHPSEFIFGKGTGSSEVLMDSLYKKKNINWNFEKKTNTHNQYLGFMMDTGFVGALLLLGFLMTSLVMFAKAKDKLGIIFIALMSLAMVSENYLNRQKGVVFFAVFFSLLYFSRNSIKTESLEPLP